MAQRSIDCEDVGNDGKDSVFQKLEAIVGAYESLRGEGLDVGSYKDLESGVLGEAEAYFEEHPGYSLDQIPMNHWGSFFVGFYKKVKDKQDSNNDVANLFTRLLRRNIAAADVVLNKGDARSQRQYAEDVLHYEEGFPCLDAKTTFSFFRYFAA